MSRIDLTSLEWCELIFKDKNKNYGAYKMRQDLGRRQLAALVIVTCAAVAALTLPRLIRMAMPEQKEEMVEVTQLSMLEEPEVKDENIVRKVEPIAPPPALKSTIKFTAPVVKKDEEVSDEDELKSQQELTETKVQISIADVKGNDELGYCRFEGSHYTGSGGSEGTALYHGGADASVPRWNYGTVEIHCQEPALSGHCPGERYSGTCHCPFRRDGYRYSRAGTGHAFARSELR